MSYSFSPNRTDDANAPPPLNSIEAHELQLLHHPELNDVYTNELHLDHPQWLPAASGWSLTLGNMMFHFKQPIWLPPCHVGFASTGPIWSADGVRSPLPDYTSASYQDQHEQISLQDQPTSYSAQQPNSPATNANAGYPLSEPAAPVYEQQAYWMTPWATSHTDEDEAASFPGNITGDENFSDAETPTHTPGGSPATDFTTDADGQHVAAVKLPIPHEPGVNFIGRIVGPRGITVKQMEQRYACKILVRGRGSVKNTDRERRLMGRPGWEHLKDDLHVLVSCSERHSQQRAQRRVDQAAQAVARLLTAEGDEELKHVQLMELAIMNGTYRPNAAKWAPTHQHDVPGDPDHPTARQTGGHWTEG